MSVLVVLGVAVTGYLWLQPTSATLLERARAIQDSNPALAESLLFRSIERSGGNATPAQWQLCQLLAAQSRWIEARGAYSQIQHPEQCPPQAVLEVSRKALDAGELILPEMAIPTTSARSEYRAAALKLMIEIATRQSQIHLARDYAVELGRLSPEDPFPWQILTRLHQQSGEIHEAIAACRKMISFDAPSATKLRWREELLEMLLQAQDATAARRELDAILRETTATPSMRLKQARLLRLEGDFQSAFRFVEQALADGQRSPEKLLVRGMLRLDLQQPEQAAKDLEEVVELQPQSKEAHYFLGRAYQLLGRANEAREHLEISTRLNRISEQIVTLENRIAREPANAELYRQLVTLCEEAGLVERANRWRTAADAIPKRAQ